MTIKGIEFREKEPLNAFLHPNNPNAVFPQYIPQKQLNFRSNYVTQSGNEF